jgi:hypothetical protein
VFLKHGQQPLIQEPARTKKRSHGIDGCVEGKDAEGSCRITRRITWMATGGQAGPDRHGGGRAEQIAIAVGIPTPSTSPPRSQT